MEKSIETIWKEGFLAQNALIAPRLNNLYAQKSQHLIDKFKRMFRINLIALVVFSVLMLGASFLVGLQYMGVPMFVLLNVIVLANYRRRHGLEKIDKNVSSYMYLKAFAAWLEDQKAFNRKLATFYYPYIFLAMVLGFWFQDVKGERLGELVVAKLQAYFPDMYLVGGAPWWGIVAVVVIVGVLAWLGGRLYNWDSRMIYGQMFRKLQEIIGDMEELRG